jgi:MarR-like DNA-binding transcriptional regulator SgrR of sgrS sRNA
MGPKAGKKSLADKLDELTQYHVARLTLNQIAKRTGYSYPHVRQTLTKRGWRWKAERKGMPLLEALGRSQVAALTLRQIAGILGCSQEGARILLKRHGWTFKKLGPRGTPFVGD